MNGSNPGEKFEIIEQALQEAVSGGMAAKDPSICSISCHIFSIDVCNINICGG